MEFEFLTVEGETCDRCGDTRAAVRAAVADARAAVPASLAVLEFVERELSAEHLAESNRVLVNGRPAEEWLGGVSVMSDCPSCSDLVGEPVCCREIEVGGVRTEAVGRDVVFDAIMAAAGLGEAVSTDGPEASSESSATTAACCAPATPAVTLVTGPGCG
ncbi:MAG: DUF2703 domain-containing protein [Coriobacteriia bacterium]|nr:DUF2703 domain-containing protein [Coriobacteriia bacterium]